VTKICSDPDYFQPPGLHFSEDSVILAKKAPQNLDQGRAADLGCGCGVVGLEALANGRLLGIKELIFVEKALIFQEYLLANLKRYNSSLYQLKALLSDWRDLTPENLGGPMDYIICNPPWFSPRNRKSPCPDKAAMRQELSGDLAALFNASEKLLRPNGRLTLAWPGQRQAYFIKALSKFPRLELCRLDCLVRYSGRLLLADIQKDGPDI
jgi:tRNA1(Val) A37 N6-methylase TrmN6